MDYAMEFWTALGGTATALLIVGSLFAWLIQHHFAKAVENYKSDLQKELAKVSAELAILNKKQEVAFTWLHTNRAQVMIDTYAKLARLKEMLDKMAQNNSYMGNVNYAPAEIKDMPAFLKKLMAAIEDYNIHIREKQILFDHITAYALGHAGAAVGQQSLLLMAKYMAKHPETKEEINQEHVASLDYQQTSATLEKALQVVQTRFQQALNVEGFLASDIRNTDLSKGGSTS